MSKKGFFESDDDYRERMSREADEGRIERTTGDAPSKGFFESQDDYEERIGREADEETVHDSTGSNPSKGFFESSDDYTDRVEREAHESIIEDVTGSAPSKGFFESQSDYEHRIEREADEATIERATGSAPSKGFFESQSDYEDRISREADEHDSDSKSSGGCFLSTACVEAAGLSDTCHELTVLRHFRDSYLSQQPRGPALIAEYYATAPRIVSRIQRSPERAAVFDAVLHDVRHAVSLIEDGQQESALAVYSAMFTRLQSQFRE